MPPPKFNIEAAGGILKDKRGEMTKCCITPVCTNIKTGGKGGDKAHASQPPPSWDELRSEAHATFCPPTVWLSRFFDQN